MNQIKTYKSKETRKNAVLRLKKQGYNFFIYVRNEEKGKFVLLYSKENCIKDNHGFIMNLDLMEPVRDFYWFDGVQ